MAMFGIGETFLSPSLPGIVNRLTGEETRGRYVAFYSLSWQAGPMIGPLIAGAALGAGHGTALFIGLRWRARSPRRPRCCSSGRSGLGESGARRRNGVSVPRDDMQMTHAHMVSNSTQRPAGVLIAASSRSRVEPRRTRRWWLVVVFLLGPDIALFLGIG